MKISIEVDVKFDEGFDGHDVDSTEISDVVSGAISECQGIEDVGSVEIKKLKIKF